MSKNVCRGGIDTYIFGNVPVEVHKIDLIRDQCSICSIVSPHVLDGDVRERVIVNVPVEYHVHAGDIVRPHMIRCSFAVGVSSSKGEFYTLSTCFIRWNIKVSQGSYAG